MNKSSILYALLLGCTSCTIHAQPINHGYWHGSYVGFLMWWDSDFVDSHGGGVYCFNEVLTTIEGGPTTAEMLAMFSSNVVQGNDGKVFAVKGHHLYHGRNSGGFPDVAEDEIDGLYEVIDQDGSCIEYRLLFPDLDITQIIHAGDTQVPIEIVAVEKGTNKIWGYYQDAGVWKRRKCSESKTWGIAREGSLVNTMKTDGRIGGIAGLHPDGRRISLYGGFGWSKSDNVICASRPAGISGWSGKWSSFRGLYCPDKDDNQLVKYTWHSRDNGGAIVIDVPTWEPARVITRLSPNSNIYGISTNSNLLSLVDDGENIISVPIRPYLLKDRFVHQIGGIGDNDEKGMFVVAYDGKGSSFGEKSSRLYNVYRDGATCDALYTYNWKAKEISIDYDDSCDRHWQYVFGNHDGSAYLLHGYPPNPYNPECGHDRYGRYTLYRLVDNDAEFVQDGSLFQFY